MQFALGLKVKDFLAEFMSSTGFMFNDCCSNRNNTKKRKRKTVIIEELKNCFFMCPFSKLPSLDAFQTVSLNTLCLVRDQENGNKILHHLSLCYNNDDTHNFNSDQACGNNTNNTNNINSDDDFGSECVVERFDRVHLDKPENDDALDFSDLIIPVQLQTCTGTILCTNQTRRSTTSSSSSTRSSGQDLIVFTISLDDGQDTLVSVTCAISNDALHAEIFSRHVSLLEFKPGDSCRIFLCNENNHVFI